MQLNSLVLQIFKALQISFSLNDMFNEMRTNIILSSSLRSIRIDYSRTRSDGHSLRDIDFQKLFE